MTYEHRLAALPKTKKNISATPSRPILPSRRFRPASTRDPVAYQAALEVLG